MSINELGLAKMIADLKREIKTAQTDDNSIFELGDVTIKAKILVSSTGKGGAKAKFYVVTAEVGGEIQTQNAHEITIVLKPKTKLFMGRREE